MVVRDSRRRPHRSLVIRAALRRILVIPAALRRVFEREDHISAVKDGIRRRVLIVHQHTAGKFGQQLSQRPLRVRAGSCGDEAHAVSRVNDGAQRRLLLVHGQRRRNRRLAAQNDTPSVQRDGKALPVPAEYVGIGVAVHQQNVAQRQHAAAEQLRGFPVEQDDIAVVQQPKPRRDCDAQRRGVLGVVQLDAVGIDALGKVVARDGHPLFVHIQLLRHLFLQPVQLTAAAGKKQRRGRRAVGFEHLLGNGRGQLIHRLVDHRHRRFIGDLIFQSHDVGVANGLSLTQRALDLLRCLEVDQKRAHQRLGDLVARNRRHGIACNAAVAADGNIRGACANVHQREVQKPQLRRNGGIHRRNGLQRHAGNLKPRRAHHGIQALDHLTGQKSRHHISLDLDAAMIEQRHHGVMVKAVLRDRVAHQKKPAALIVLRLQRLLRRRHRSRFELADLLDRDHVILRQGK